MLPASNFKRLQNALPFWLTLTLLPLVGCGLFLGGWYVLLVPVYGWGVMAILDEIFGLELASADPETPEADLFWYRLITLIWFPIQFVVVFGSIWIMTHTEILGAWEKVGMIFGIGVTSGTVGIVYSHELIHQKTRLERWLGDLLMGLTLYGHFRTEHLLVHHPYVGTPRDTVTAPYNQGFHRYFGRVLVHGYRSAWRAEKAMLARRDLPAFHKSNPHWLYWGLQIGFLVFAFLIGGWVGVGLFVSQAFVAVWQLELTNYVEHYGLTRKHLGDGEYEHCKPHHSWNAAQRVSNLLLLNLQRHSDHHYKPARRYPLLQNYTEAEAPQLPRGYPVMTALAMIPPLWRRKMNPRVRKWRAMYYPEITDWTPYKNRNLPKPRGS